VVKCNYLLDTHNTPVDSDFLSAKLPSGDGIAGGDFESWFILKSREVNPPLTTRRSSRS